MRHFSTVEAAVKLAIDMFEVNRMISDTESIRSCIYSWYSHSDVTDIEMLAACALEGKTWHTGATYEEMEKAKNEWFPENPYDDYFSIEEIEAAQKDFLWW